MRLSVITVVLAGSMMISLSQVTSAAIPIELDLSRASQMEVELMADGGYAIATTGDDPWIMSQPIKEYYDPVQHYILSFEYFCAEGTDSIQLYFGPPIKEDQSATGPELLSSEGWTRYSLDIMSGQVGNSWKASYKEFRLDFGRQTGKTIQVRNIQLRAPDAHERQLALGRGDRKARAAALESELQALVDRKYTAGIDRVVATDNTIRLAVRTESGLGPLFLCEIPFYQSPVGRGDFVWQQPVPEKDGLQGIELPRLRGQHDRVFSSWILMRQTSDGLVPASHQRFVEEMPSQWSLTRDRPLSRKGIAGLHGGDKLQFDDYKTLGIHNMTHNIVLSGLVTDKPGQDTFPHAFNGTTVHIKRGALDHLDHAMLEAEQLKIVVSSIILIPKSTPMSHPDCAPEGIYAMANVVEEPGWNIYAAGLDFLAQRYMRPDRKYGRITHWILHNEVDSGWIWTNAGDIPMHTFMDLQYRSMRTAQSVIRRYGSAGSVLLSLTHYWTARHNAKCHPPKDMIDLLARRCSHEGDFDWGLANHPYPENLRDPRTWLDKTATLDFNTARITPKNLEILDAYMKQPTMRYAGRTVRTIVLSEQGSNSAKHDPQAYRDQAAGLVYTWLKLEKLESIESYVHHRWMDHPQEGGLNLGVRRDKNVPNGNARQAAETVCREMAAFGIACTQDETSKPAWDVYRILATPEQGNAVKWMSSIIPASYLPFVDKSE